MWEITTKGLLRLHVTQGRVHLQHVSTRWFCLLIFLHEFKVFHRTQWYISQRAAANVFWILLQNSGTEWHWDLTRTPWPKKADPNYF